LYSELTLKTNAKLALLVMDGLGDIATTAQGRLTPLEAAHTPNLDALAKESAQGRMIPVAPGITPGSGPGHLGLFGYGPLEFQVGRGVIEALGLGVELKPGDVCARANFATLDAKGVVTDRRAGTLCGREGHHPARAVSHDGDVAEQARGRADPHAVRPPVADQDALQEATLRVADNSPLRIIPLPHLVVLKLYAGGLKSMTDIVEVLTLNEDADLDAIEALCKQYRIQGFAKIREELKNR
jgi:hypothetical protein